MNDPRLIAGITLAIERASVEAVATLRNAGVAALLIKGPPQQAWLAPAGSPRASVDVDLLVDPTDASRAEAKLSALGYGLEPEVTPGVEHHATLWRAAGRVAVEIHRTLPGTDPRLIWPVLGGETEAAEIAGEAVQIPNEAARCLIVALHAAHHGAGENAPLYDLERAVNVAGRATWERAAELARAAGAETAFVTGLGLVSSGEALRAELGLQPPPLSERLAMNLAPPVSGTPGFYWLAQQKSLAAKTRYIGRKLVPPADFMRFKYPYARKGPGRLTLAYLFRPLWIARWAVPGFLSWQRVRATAAASAGPAEVRGRDAILRDGNTILSVRMLPWTLLLPALKRILPLPRLARLMWTEPAAATGTSADDVLALAGALTHLRPLPSRGNCLERSLLAYRYLARAGLGPSLVVGIARDDVGAVEGHAWIEIGGVPVREPKGVDRFTRVAAFGAGGQGHPDGASEAIPPTAEIDCAQYCPSVP